MRHFQGLGWATALLFAWGLGLAQAQPAAPARPPVAPARPQAVQPAATARVDINLVLAVDASGSVDDDRFELQKQGYAKAFLSPRVLNAIRNGNEGAISISMVQWTGPTLHVIMVPWMVVRDQRSAQLAATAIAAAPRQIFGGGTSLSGAIDFAVTMLTASPYRAERRVIDISGDGSNNLGRPAEQARDEAVKMGIRINGLPILAVEPDLDMYFRESVIGGPGAFIIPVKDYNAFGDAIMRKLVQEISQDQKPRTEFAEK
jgi:Mg-chelatase subunit ChlD